MGFIAGNFLRGVKDNNADRYLSLSNCRFKRLMCGSCIEHRTCKHTRRCANSDKEFTREHGRISLWDRHREDVACLLVSMRIAISKEIYFVEMESLITEAAEIVENLRIWFLMILILCLAVDLILLTE